MNKLFLIEAETVHLFFLNQNDQILLRAPNITAHDHDTHPTIKAKAIFKFKIKATLIDAQNSKLHHMVRHFYLQFKKSSMKIQENDNTQKLYYFLQVSTLPLATSPHEAPNIHIFQVAHRPFMHLIAYWTHLQPKEFPPSPFTRSPTVISSTHVANYEPTHSPQSPSYQHQHYVVTQCTQYISPYHISNIRPSPTSNASDITIWSILQLLHRHAPNTTSLETLQWPLNDRMISSSITKDIVSLLLHEVSIHSSTFLLQVNLNESTIPTKYNDKQIFILVPISSEKSDNALPNDTATTKLSLSFIYESHVEIFSTSNHLSLPPLHPPSSSFTTKNAHEGLPPTAPNISAINNPSQTFPIPQMQNSVPHTMSSKRHPPFDPFSAPWASPSLTPLPCI